MPRIHAVMSFMTFSSISESPDGGWGKPSKPGRLPVVPLSERRPGHEPVMPTTCAAPMLVPGVMAATWLATVMNIPALAARAPEGCT